MRKHGGTPSRRDKHVTLAAISPPGVARGRFVEGQQSGLAGSKPPPLFAREASSCSSQGRRQGETWGASPRPSAPTYLPPWGTGSSQEGRANIVAYDQGLNAIELLICSSGSSGVIQLLVRSTIPPFAPHVAFCPVRVVIPSVNSKQPA